ncbi:MAG TPA: hypothetical protein VFI49_07660 [Rudaea sp.]|nr:hypothetical protein [Rudaea sp.]
MTSIVLMRAAAASPLDVPKYFVVFDGQMARVDVKLCLDRAHVRVEFAPDSPRAMGYLSDMRRSGAGELDTASATWRASNWRAGECLAYTANIGAIADQHSDSGTRYGTNIVTDPQHWLVHSSAQGSNGAEATIDLADGWSISAPWHELARDGKRIRFQIPDTPPDWSASLVLGNFEETRIELPGGVLRVATVINGDDKQREKLVGWMRRVGQALLTAYGRLPLADVQVWLVSVDNWSLAGRFFAFLHPGAVLGGESARGQGNALQLDVDPSRPEQEFNEDWTAVHELSHLLHPYLGNRGSWLGEGLATYYQNVLRARGGLLTPKQAWQRLASGFQRGQAGPYAESLEQAAADMGHGHAFLRVYWSGAAYWLTVDMELRRLSGGKLTVDTALSRFRDCCLPAYREWKPEDFVAKLDAVLGVKTFTRHYREFARMKRFPDWQARFARLGVRAGEDSVTFDAAAPDAVIRDAITAPLASQAQSNETPPN